MDNGWFYEKMAASQAPSAPAAQPSNPSPKPKVPHRWIFPIIVGVIMLIFIPVVIIAFSGKTGTPADNPPEQQEAKNPYGETGIQDIGYAQDMSNYLVSLASDPDYEPVFESDATLYGMPPAKLSCSDLIEVTEMNKNLLDLYLDYKFVVIFSGKGSTPFTDSGNSILVFGGDLTQSKYYTVPYNCPSPTATNVYKTYSYSDLYNNLTSDQRYYIWIDPSSLKIVE